MLPILARAAGGAMARKIMGRKTNVRVGQAQPQSSNAIVKSEKFTGRSTKASTALVRPPAPMKQVSGGTVSKDDPIKVIHTKTLAIEKILEGTLASEKAELKRKKSDFRNQSRQDQEDKLEKKDLKPDKKMKMPKVPGTGGIFGWIRKFIGNIIMGIFLIKMIDHVDKLKGIVMVLGNVADFISEVGIKLVDGLATFVDWGYKAYDATQGFLKNFGVQPELFDQFAGALSGLIDALIIGSIILAARGEDGFGPGGLDKARRPGGRRPGVTTGRGGQSPRFRFPGTGPRVTQSGGPRRPGAPVTQGRGSRIPGTGTNRGSYQLPPGARGPRGPVGNLPGKGLGKGGLFGLIMLIPTLFEAGGLISQGYWKTAANVLLSTGAAMAAYAGTIAGINLLAAAAGVGSGGLAAGPAIALMIGSHAAAIGASMGTYALTSKALKALGLRDDDPALKAQGYQEGGRITKKTKVKRGIKTKKKPKKLNLRKPTKQNLKDLPPPTQGQEPAQQRAWWDFLGWAGTGQRQPLGPGGEMLAEKVTNVGNTLGRDDFFGPILKVTSKIILDQEVNNIDYQNVGRGINLLLNKGIKVDKVAQGSFKYQDGGEVLPIKTAIDAGRWVENTFKETVRKSSEKSFMRSGSTFSNTGTETPGSGTTPGTGTTPGGTTPSGGSSARFGSPEMKALLDVLAYAEGTLTNRNGATGPAGYSTWAGYQMHGPTDLTGLTIQEVHDLQTSFMKAGKTALTGSAVVGRYQFKDLLAHYAPQAGLSGSDLFSPENQDAMAIAEIKRAGITTQMLKDNGITQGYLDILAPIWASMPYSPKGGASYYGGQPSKPAKELKDFYKQKLGVQSSQQVGQNTPAAPLITPPSAPVGNASKPVGPAPGPANADKESIAGALGDYMKANRSKIGVTGSIHQWLPRHPGKFVRGYQSWHNVNRALDIGGWSPSSPEGGGADEQAPVIAALLEWNKKNGYNPVELIHGSPAYKNVGSYRKYPDAHHHHVHVAYEKGGMTLDGPHLAMLGEKGKEIVIDNDSSISEVTPMLLAINAAKTKQGVLDAIQNFAPYDERSNKTIFVQEEEMPEENGYGGQARGGLLPVMMGSPDNSFDFLEYQG